MKDPSHPDLPAWPVVNDRLTCIWHNSAEAFRYSQGEVLEHQGITGTEGRAGKRGSHLGTAENPTPNGQPQGCDKDAPTGRMARSLTQREDWTRDSGGCLPAWWQAAIPR